MLCVPHTSSILCGCVIQSVGYISLCSLIVPCEMSSLLPCHCQPVRWICCWGLFLAGFSWGCTEPTECSALGAAACRGWVLGIAHWSYFQIQPHGRRGQTRRHQPLALGRIGGDQRTRLWWAQAAAEKDHRRYGSLSGCFERCWDLRGAFVWTSIHQPVLKFYYLQMANTTAPGSWSFLLSVFAGAELCLQCS